MSATEILVAVKAVLSAFVTSKKTFTAWNVTKEVRQSNPDAVPHQAVRKALEFVWISEKPENYNRQIVELQNGQLPFVYFADGNNPLDYYAAAKPQQDSQQDNQPILPASIPAAD